MLPLVTRSSAAALPRADIHPRASARVWALLLLLITLLLPRVTTAARPVIAPGREQEILALFEPHALGDELVPGWTLHSFSIDSATIIVWIAGPDDDHAQLTLDHPDYGPEHAQQLEGFALTVVEQPSGSEAAVAELIAIIDRNDHGEFWQREVLYADEPRDHPFNSAGFTLLRDWSHARGISRGHAPLQRRFWPFVGRRDTCLFLSGTREISHFG